MWAKCVMNSSPGACTDTACRVLALAHPGFGTPSPYKCGAIVVFSAEMPTNPCIDNRQERDTLHS